MGIFFLWLSLIQVPGMWPVTPGAGAQQASLGVMWYNVENLFYPGDDTLSGDDPFTPAGSYHWTYERYRKKLTALAKVIIAAGGWEPPDVVGLCEVEGATVLEGLVGHPLLKPYGYSYLHRESPDHRGMDVACIYRGPGINLHSWDTYASSGPAPGTGTREILHFCGVWGEEDTLDLFLVHLISKYSGAGVTAEPRREQVERVVHLADSVARARPGGVLVIAGDFNDEPGEYTMEPFEAMVGDSNRFRSLPREGMGSYKYRGRWSMIDRFMVRDRFGSYRLEGSILRLPALLIPDETYGGEKPNRTYIGYIYNGGVSDHLPLILRISRPPFSIRSRE